MKIRINFSNKILFYAFCLLYIIHTATSLNPNQESIVQKITDDLEKFFIENTKIDTLKGEYTKYMDNNILKLMNYSDEETILQYATKLSNVLRKKKEALQKVVLKAESIAAGYTWNPTLKNVKYVYAKNFSDSPGYPNALEFLQTSAQFIPKVMLNMSSVHIPTEVFNGDEVNHTLYWTNALDMVMAEVNDSLHYQYFASTHGPLRIYPGTLFAVPEDMVDMYDARRRPWYVQGSSSPKNMLILIDTSGSMKGQSLKLAQLSVKKLVDSLGENDYVAIGQFPGKDKILNPNLYPHLLSDRDNSNVTFHTFVQATKRNKDRLFELIDCLQAENQANMEKAMYFAFDLFGNFTEKEENSTVGAKCNNIIVVLSDGDNDNPDILYNSTRSEMIRIFTYLVGQHGGDSKPMEKIACKNQGFFGRIPSYGAVSNIIQDLSDHLDNFEMAGEGVQHVETRETELVLHKSEIEIDRYPGYDFLQGMGLMTSLTMPVFNRTGNQTLLGVMGTDMTVKDLMKDIPNNMLMPNGYAFAINTNGYIVFHPQLKAQHGWMRDPPNVDFLEIEFPSENPEEKEELRRLIIDSGMDGKKLDGTSDVVNFMTIGGLVKAPDFIHTYFRRSVYTFMGLPHSTFGLAVVRPTQHVAYTSYLNANWALKKSNDTGSFYIEVPDSSGTAETKDLVIFNNSIILVSNRFILDCYWPDSYLDRSFIITTVPTPTTFSTFFYDQFNGTSMGNSSSNVSSTTNATTTVSTELPTTTTVTASPLTTQSTQDEKSRALKLTEFVPTFDGLKELLAENSSHCSDDVRGHFLADLLIAENFIRTFIEIQDENVQSVVISLNSGVTVIFPNTKEAESHHIHLKNNWNETVYQRAFDDANMYIFHVKFQSDDYNEQLLAPNETNIDIDNGEDDPWANVTQIFSIYKAISLPTPNSRGYFIPGIVGISLPTVHMQSYFNSSSDCANSVCYMLDDAAIIISINHANRSYQIGYFLGDVDPSLMNALLNSYIYARVDEDDYQALCSLKKEEKSSSNGVSNFPIPSIIRYLIQFLNPWYIFNQLQILLTNVSYVLWSIIIIAFSHLGAAQETTSTSNPTISCIKSGQRYYFNESSTMNSSKFVCNETPREFNAARIPSTNLVLVSVTPKDNNCNESIVPRKFVEKKFGSTEGSGPDIHTLALNPRYRRRPEKCYQLVKKEITICSGRTISLAVVVLFNSWALPLWTFATPLFIILLTMTFHV